MFDENYIVFLLVLTRISGALLFNPLLGRKNVPAIAKMGLAAGLAAGIMPTLGNSVIEITMMPVFLITVVKELLVGFSMGFIMQLVMSMVSVAGSVIDMQLGLLMSKVYDPQTGTSNALTGTVYNLYFILVFFLTNSHHTFIRLVTESCELFPVGTITINLQAGSYIVLIFGDVLILALKLAMPVLAVELLAEAGLGFIMRAVPNINVFAIGLQTKTAVGLSIFTAALPMTSKVLDQSITYLFLKIKDGLSILLGG